MNSHPKVLVVGTTSDYIDWIQRTCPGQGLFLTEPVVRRQALEESPGKDEEILCKLNDSVRTWETVSQHLERTGIEINGVACFDCESMELASILARNLGLPYPSLRSIRNCRDKHVSKILWHQNDVQCPQVRMIRTVEEAAKFMVEMGGVCVLKPLIGSGSELVHLCRNLADCEKAMPTIQNGLKKRKLNEGLQKQDSDEKPDERHQKPNTENMWVGAEEYIEGVEYSCDFRIENDYINLIRITQKFPGAYGPLGTTQGYVLVNGLPNGIKLKTLTRILSKGAQALGLDRAICMVDFIIHNNQIRLLEMTPRPGGDCLPSLLYRNGRLDILKMTLDFARKRQMRPGHVLVKGSLVGLRLHARKSGVLRHINSEQMAYDPRVDEVRLIRQPGNKIQIPPEDYDSWVLGHVIFKPFPEVDLAVQLNELSDQLSVEIN
ncbi:ATP-grasp domain-containing protein [bacterium]|nr:ATP-grasp domain-containing protein [bacterium]